MNRFILLAFFVSLSALAQTEKLETVEVHDHNGDGGLTEYAPVAKSMDERAIRKNLRPTLADTIATMPGVTSTGFGPNASRPVLRGLDGSRIRLLQNSLQLLDASTQSVDHAIPVDPLIVDQIEIVRGSAGLLYGASAVGGVVNIVTNRIHTKFEEGKVIELQSQGESVNNGLSNSVRMDYGKNQWMFHIDASTKNLMDQKIPGHALTSRARAEDPDRANEKDKLQNSQSHQDTIGAGATRFFNRGMIGLAFNHFKTDYGTVAEKEVTIGMEQNRMELHGEYRPEHFIFNKVRLKSAQTDYRHREFEGGATGTYFKNVGNETRLEGINEKGNWQGTTGLQTDTFHFTTRGEEAFLPQTDNQIAALFTHQQLTLGSNVVSAAGRVESTTIHKENSPNSAGMDNFSFTGLNGSTGITHQINTENSLALNYSYTERAPTFQELLANGAHLATGTFELGNTALKKEKANGVDLTYKNTTARSSFTASVYSQYFKDYIALSPTGNTQANLPEYSYRQVDAVVYGLDVDAKNQLIQNEKGLLSLISKFDLVQGRDRENHQNLPRLSPPRLSVGLEHEKGNWDSDFEVQHVFDQNLTAPIETRTSAYTLTNIGTQYSFVTESTKFDLFLRVRNIFDVEARSHVSFLKEIAPLPGRNIILGVHWLL